MTSKHKYSLCDEGPKMKQEKSFVLGDKSFIFKSFNGSLHQKMIQNLIG